MASCTYEFLIFSFHHWSLVNSLFLHHLNHSSAQEMHEAYFVFSIALLSFLGNWFVSNSVKVWPHWSPLFHTFISKVKGTDRQGSCSWCQGAVGTGSALGLCSRSSKGSPKGLTTRAHPTAQGSCRAAGVPWDSPSHGHWYLHGDKDGPRPGQDVSSGHHGPRPGRARLGGAGLQPCCGVTEAGADGPGEMMWAGVGNPRTVAGQGHDVLEVPLGPWFFTTSFPQIWFLSSKERSQSFRDGNSYLNKLQ